MLEFVCEQEYEKQYPLTTMISAYSTQEELVLVFLEKRKRIVRRYRINEGKRVVFLSEILRLCRIYKKGLTNPNNK